MTKRYAITDGRMVILLEEAEEGGFTVTSPIDPGVITEAFANARDAMKELARARASLARRLSRV